MFGPERFAASGPSYVVGWRGTRIARLACAPDTPRIWQGRVADVVGAIMRLAGRLERAADCLFRILRGTYERGVAP